MKLTNWKVLSMTALMAVAMAACNTSEAKKEGKEVSAQTQQHQQEENHEHEHEHEEHASTRFIVSSNEKVIVFNDKFEEVKHFEIGQAAFTLADSGRFIFVRDATNKDSYTLLDSGIYVEDHGNHDHPYNEEPVLATSEIEANKPAHMISHAGQTAIFNDGSGKVDVFENDDIQIRAEKR